MRSVRSWGVLSSTAAPVLLIGGWTLAARLQPGHFDQVSGTISALAGHDARHRWVMTAALAGVGAAHVATALALRPAPLAARWLLATGGVATVAVAAYPLPAGGGRAPEHALAAGVAFVALAAWPTLSLRRRSPGTSPDAAAPIPFRPAVALAASGALIATLGWFVAELVQDSGRVGLSERAAAGSQALWPLAAVLLARRSRQRP
jgi:uncharacterized protein DUF998